MVTTERKTEVCKKYNIYLKLIEQFFNRIILQEQLIKIILIFGIEKKREDVLKSLRELEECDIIKRQPFSANSRFIIFRKFAIRYLYEKKKSSMVAAFKMPGGNAQAFYKHMFKAEYIINLIEQNNIKSPQELVRYLKSNNMSFYYNKPKKIKLLYKNLYLEFNGEVYVNPMEEEKRKEEETKKKIKYMDKKKIDEDIKKIEANQESILNILNNGGEKTEVTKKKTKVEMVAEDISIATLLKRNVFIDKFSLDKELDTLTVKLNYMDTNNTQDLDTIVFVYSLAYNCFNRLFKVNKLLINITVCTHSKQACENLKDKQEKNKTTVASGKVTYFGESFVRYSTNPNLLILNYRSYNIKRYLV